MAPGHYVNQNIIANQTSGNKLQTNLDIIYQIFVTGEYF